MSKGKYYPYIFCKSNISNEKGFKLQRSSLVSLTAKVGLAENSVQQDYPSNKVHHSGWAKFSGISDMRNSQSNDKRLVQ